MKFNLKFLFFCISCVNASQKPNIIVIVADDLGWNDVSYHDEARQIPTPNIDALGMNGVILNRHYTQPLCTPTRSAFLTGQYPIHTGTQVFVIEAHEPWGLPLDKKLLPEYLHEGGYINYLVGKWHLGFWKKTYTPLQRGYDHHYGYWGPFIDYWRKTYEVLYPFVSDGIDFRKDYEVLQDNTTYVTDLFTKAAIEYINGHPRDKPMFLHLNHLAPHTASPKDPLQAPKEEILKFMYIKDPKRRTYAAMVSKLDESIGKVVVALKENQMLKNSIILFFSDNGAPVYGLHANHGSNYPLRGQKNSPWEGGIRSPTVIWSPLIKHNHRVYDGLIHVTDWMPTLLTAAGLLPNLNLTNSHEIDGVDQWKSIVHNLPSKRNEFLVNINSIIGWGAVIKDNWKLVKGVEGPLYNEWLSSPNEPHLTDKQYAYSICTSDVYKSIGSLSKREIIKLSKSSVISCNGTVATRTKCMPSEYCLFDLNHDKCEYNNVARLYPEKVNELTAVLLQYTLTIHMHENQPADPNANPAYYNNTWTHWGDLNRYRNR